MDSIMAGPDASPIFYIGQDDSHRSVPVSVELLGLAQEAGVCLQLKNEQLDHTDFDYSMI